MDNKIKVGIISIYSAPYRDDTFKLLANQEDISLTVLSLGEKHLDHTEWQYKSGLNTLYFGKNRWKLLKSLGVSVLVIAGDYFTTMSAVLYCIIHKTPYIIMADSVEKNVSGSRFSTIKTVVWRNVLEKANAIWCSGKRSKEFFSGLVSRPEKIYCGCYTFDASKIKDQAELSDGDKNELLMELFGCIPNEPIFLFVGHLIKSRNIKALIDASEKLSRQVAFKLLIIGDGEDADQIDTTRKNIRHIKAVPFEDLHKYYGISTCYVHPGKEPYSLALYEAAIVGLPIVASDQVGAVDDCLIDGENGYVIKNLDSDILAKAMLKIVNKEYNVEKCKEMSKFILDERSILWAQSQLKQAIYRSCDM